MSDWTQTSGEVKPGVWGSAVISNDGVYRYRLTRRWNDEALMVFVMLNPSTADGLTDDPTIRRCQGFAEREGYGGLVVVNLYALRSTDPSLVHQHPDPIGDANASFIGEAYVGSLREGAPMVCAWGTKAKPGAAEALGRLLRTVAPPFEPVLHCLGTTKDGHPKHPLYLSGGTPLEQWRPSA